MSAPIQITALEHALLQVEPLAYAAPQIVAAIPSLLRLARAAHAVSENINPDVGCKRPCPDCEFHRALAAFDFTGARRKAEVAS